MISRAIVPPPPQKETWRTLFELRNHAVHREGLDANAFFAAVEAGIALVTFLRRKPDLLVAIREELVNAIREREGAMEALQRKLDSGWADRRAHLISKIEEGDKLQEYYRQRDTMAFDATAASKLESFMQTKFANVDGASIKAPNHSPFGHRMDFNPGTSHTSRLYGSDSLLPPSRAGEHSLDDEEYRKRIYADQEDRERERECKYQEKKAMEAKIRRGTGRTDQGQGTTGSMYSQTGIDTGRARGQSTEGGDEVELRGKAGRATGHERSHDPVVLSGAVFRDKPAHFNLKPPISHAYRPVGMSSTSSGSLRTMEGFACAPRSKSSDGKLVAALPSTQFSDAGLARFGQPAFAQYQKSVSSPFASLQRTTAVQDVSAADERRPAAVQHGSTSTHPKPASAGQQIATGNEKAWWDYFL